MHLCKTASIWPIKEIYSKYTTPITPHQKEPKAVRVMPLLKSLLSTKIVWLSYYKYKEGLLKFCIYPQSMYTYFHSFLHFQFPHILDNSFKKIS